MIASLLTTTKDLQVKPARLKTSSQELRLYESFRSVYLIFENFASGKEYIRENQGTRRRPLLHRMLRRPFTIQKISNTCSMSHFSRNFVNKRHSRRRSPRRSEEATDTMLSGLRRMRRGQSRLERQSTHLTMLSASVTPHSLMRCEILTTVCLCSSYSLTSLPHQRFQQR